MLALFRVRLTSLQNRHGRFSHLLVHATAIGHLHDGDTAERYFLYQFMFSKERALATFTRGLTSTPAKLYMRQIVKEESWSRLHHVLAYWRLHDTKHRLLGSLSVSGKAQEREVGGK